MGDMRDVESALHLVVSNLKIDTRNVFLGASESRAPPRTPATHRNVACEQRRLSAVGGKRSRSQQRRRGEVS